MKEETAEYWIQEGEDMWIDSDQDEDAAAEALKYFDKALDIDPLNALAWSNMGFMLKKLDRSDEALGCYEKAIEIDEGFVNAWYNKCVLLRTMDQLEEAMKCADKVVALDPDHKLAKQERDMLAHKMKKQKNKEKKKGLLGIIPSL